MEAMTVIGITAVLLGMLLVFLEIINPGIYIIVPGTVLVVLGILALVAQDFLLTPWGALVLVIIGTVTTWLAIQAYRKWAKPGDAPVTMASDSLPGRTGKVEQAIPADGTGRVRVEGQVWRAESAQPLAVGTRIRVTSVDSLTLTVEPLQGAQ